jgi:hypothetical protein
MGCGRWQPGAGRVFTGRGQGQPTGNPPGGGFTPARRVVRWGSPDGDHVVSWHEDGNAIVPEPHSCAWRLPNGLVRGRRARWGRQACSGTQCMGQPWIRPVGVETTRSLSLGGETPIGAGPSLRSGNGMLPVVTHTGDRRRHRSASTPSPSPSPIRAFFIVDP